LWSRAEEQILKEIKREREIRSGGKLILLSCRLYKGKGKVIMVLN
jgi:hypothetical protein